MAAESITEDEVQINERTGPPRYVKDKTGLRFGRLTVLGFSHFVKKRRQRLAAWRVRCDCGTVKSISNKHLGKPTRSCGCLQREYASSPKPNKRTHGYCRTRLYGIYRNMMERCFNEKCPSFHNYGGRGIFVCQEWALDNISFFKWAESNGHSPGLDLDRIDNDRGYAPDNCRWVTRQVNSNNRRTNVFVEYRGERMTVADLARKTGTLHDRISQRIRRGWTAEEAVTIPRHLSPSRKLK